MIDCQKARFICMHFISAVVLTLFMPSLSRAQYINFVFNIEPEVTARTEQTLNFGLFAKNAGQQVINLGDRYMGIFSITTLEQQQLLINIQPPKALNHNNKSAEGVLPLDLKVNYGYSRDDYKNTKPLSESLHSILVPQNPDGGAWSKIYIFMYGSIYIGNVTEGLYANDLILTVMYI